ncbi:hypothetical protein LXJ15735_28180 [Lacrimispora xylanolytica]
MTKTARKEVVKAIAKVFEVSPNKVTLLESSGDIEGFKNNGIFDESEENFSINIRYNNFLSKGYGVLVSCVKSGSNKDYIAHSHTVIESEAYDTIR